MKKELGIYIHIPFCVKKCYYCDFISYANKEEVISNYIEALKREIKYNIYGHYINPQETEIATIYIGGGTPSFINSKYIISILNTMKKVYSVKENAEITIEVNPGTVSKEKLKDYKIAGINRISIGLQSTNNKLLKQIGRIHTYEQFLESYKIIKETGFKNVNVDLMLALPNQTIEMLRNSLKQVIELNPEHISVYSLILEEGTHLYNLVENKRIELPNEEIERDMYWKAKDILEQNGYKHYEISNFSKEGLESKHNLNCWNQEEYIGFGLASHSYINNTRYSNTEDINKYINFNEKKDIVLIHEIQKDEEKKKEFMLLGLRKIDGIKISEFKEKFIQNPLYLYRNEINKLVQKELLEVDGDNIKLTNKGIDLANIVFTEFI